MDINIDEYDYNIFEELKHIDDKGNEFWYARDLQSTVEYTEWRNFESVIKKAKEACEKSDNIVSDHFVDSTRIVNIGVSSREINDMILSRYACYLIVMNADPKKSVVALGQTYFALKTRQQELTESFDTFSENKKRMAIRNELKHHNKSLAEAANMSGVITPKDFAIFQNCGYKGLYDGLSQKDIHKRKGLKKSEKILDHMGSTELAANLFRATQTDDKLRRENIYSKSLANKTHFDVGKKVRETIQELGGTMPEDLPTPDKSIRQIENEHKKNIKSRN